MHLPTLLAFLLVICCYEILPAQTPSHPRGLITQAEVAPLRARMQREPWQPFLQQLKTRVIREMQIPPGELDAYQSAYLCTQLATLYLLTEEPRWAAAAWTQMEQILADPVFSAPTSRGLTRAMLLQQAAISYDLCYHGWTEAQRAQVGDALFPALLSVAANMGPEANYNIASNWMGVRYGAVILAASVWDDPEAGTGTRSRALPFLWDATKRLQDHLETNLYKNGWNGESMGYHAYNWSFLAPALIALQNGSSSPAFLLENFIPKARNSLWAISTSQVDIPTRDGRGMKADLSEDNLHACPPGLLATGFRLFPDEHLPYLQWMFDYRFRPDRIDDARDGLVYSLLYYPENGSPRNPAEAGWLHYHDPEQGVAVFRNRFRNVSREWAPSLEQLGMVTDAKWMDLDGDGDLDLVITGEWMPITLLENKGGRLVPMEHTGLEQESGWWFSVEAGDFDGDGDMDFVAGNLGNNYKYKTSHEEPFQVFLNDFDESGTLDIVLGYFDEGTLFPVRGRQCSAEQMPFIKEKFPTYDLFGKADLAGIYGLESLDRALNYKARNFQSSFVENLGNGTFKIAPLPIEAQMSALNDFLVQDFNGDGHLDFLAAGNLFASEVETPRNDAGVGILLLGNGKGGFAAVPAHESGIYLPHDIRHLAFLRRETPGTFILAAPNNEALRLIQQK